MVVLTDCTSEEWYEADQRDCQCSVLVLVCEVTCTAAHD
jgi:hypothetical protein